jgi:hypothetical protein
MRKIEGQEWEQEGELGGSPLVQMRKDGNLSGSSKDGENGIRERNLGGCLSLTMLWEWVVLNHFTDEKKTV